MNAAGLGTQSIPFPPLITFFFYIEIRPDTYLRHCGVRARGGGSGCLGLISSREHASGVGREMGLGLN